MISIFKYPVNITDEQMVAMPKGAEILSVQVQHGSACLWAMVNTENPNTFRRINIKGTGHPIHGELGTFIGTVQFDNGVLVFHVFDGGENG